MRIIKSTLLLVMLYMASCSDKKTPGEDIIQEEKNVYKVEKQTFFLDEKSKEEPYFLLGFGYDASKNLLSVNDGIKGQVLDLTKINNIEARTDIDQGAKSEGQNNTDISKADVLIEMSLFPDYAAIASTGDLLADFPSHGLYYNYAKAISKSYKLHDSSPSDAHAFTVGFAGHIEHSTPEEIVAIFGTHMIVGCSKGYWFKSIGYVEQETETPQLITKEWKATFYCSGGDTDKITFDQEDINVGGQAWRSSYDEDENGEFVDFNRSYPIPLYELLPDGDKRMALQNYIEEYLK